MLTDAAARPLKRTVALALTLALPFATIPLPIPAQMIPLTSVLALLVALPLVMFSHPAPSTPLSRMTSVWVAFMVGWTFLLLLLDFTTVQETGIRFGNAVRQMLSLLAGWCVYVVFRRTLGTLEDGELQRWMFWAALPALGVGLLHVMWGVVGVPGTGALVQGVRALLVPDGYTDASRVAGLAFEPSHFAYYLTIAVFPFLIWRYQTTPTPALKGAIALTLVVFLGTFSGFGYALLLGVGFVLLSVMGKLNGVRILSYGLGVAVLGGMVAVLFPDNYILLQVRYNLLVFLGQAAVDGSIGDGEGFSATLLDAWFSTFGPFLRWGDSPQAFFGVGLGGTALYLDALIPPDGVAVISMLRYEQFPSLGTLTGRIAAEAGFIGVLLYLGVVVTYTRQARTLVRFGKEMNRSSFIPLGHIGIAVGFGILFSYSVKIGTFASPYGWLWMALLDVWWTRAHAGSDRHSGLNG